MADYQSILLKLNNSSNTLREREARYAGNAPVDLLNQITDYEQAISLTQQVLASDLSEAEWNQSLRSLNIDQTLIEGGFFQKIFQTLSIPSEGQRDLRNRQIMLQRVRDFWIEGVLEISLHNEVLIDLKMESKPEAVDNPWDTVIQQPEQPDHVLSSESKITDVFDESGGSLLILGEPGSGKTTILLDLGRQLIARAQTDLSQPIPVVFNLSSWVGQRLPLSEWLVEELNTKYSIPKKLAQRWIDDDALLLLLDGLDEVTQQHRTACVEAINSFNQDSLTSIVVCSRIRAYEAVGVRLNLRQAIVLQPLSQQQIETYLQPNVGSSNLVALLQEEPDLQAFMNTPLILNIIALTGQDTDTQAMVKQDSAETHLKQLFQAYVSEMFKRRGSSARYDENQTAVWLTWLAKKMTQFNQTIFLIESLQPSWLPQRNQRSVYIFFSRILLAIIVQFGVALTAGLSDGVEASLIVGSALGIAIAGLDILRLERSVRLNRVNPSVTAWTTTINVTGIGVVVFVVMGILIALAGDRINNPIELFLRAGFVNALVFGLIFGIRGSRRTLSYDIHSTEALNWSPRKMVIGGLLGLVVGFVLGIVGGMVYGAVIGSRYVLMDGLIFAVNGGVIGCVFGGLTRNVIEEKEYANQGMVLSARNALIMGVTAGVMGLFTFVLSSWLTLVLQIDSGLGLAILERGAGLFFIALSVGLLAGGWYGGFDVIQHLTLRIILWRTRHIPWNLARFLDYGVDRIFLRRVGGGYIFIHRYLMEYFASLESEQ